MPSFGNSLSSLFLGITTAAGKEVLDRSRQKHEDQLQMDMLRLKQLEMLGKSVNQSDPGSLNAYMGMLNEFMQGTQKGGKKGEQQKQGAFSQFQQAAQQGVQGPTTAQDRWKAMSQAGSFMAPRAPEQTRHSFLLTPEEEGRQNAARQGPLIAEQERARERAVREHDERVAAEHERLEDKRIEGRIKVAEVAYSNSIKKMDYGARIKANAKIRERENLYTQQYLGQGYPEEKAKQMGHAQALDEVNQEVEASLAEKQAKIESIKVGTEEKKARIPEIEARTARIREEIKEMPARLGAYMSREETSRWNSYWNTHYRIEAGSIERKLGELEKEKERWKGAEAKAKGWGLMNAFGMKSKDQEAAEAALKSIDEQLNALKDRREKLEADAQKSAERIRAGGGASGGGSSRRPADHNPAGLDLP